MNSIVIYDGTNFFVKSSIYRLGKGEMVVFRGSFEACSDYVDSQKIPFACLHGKHKYNLGGRKITVDDFKSACEMIILACEW